ncbi:MAG: CDP-alcohol phosphatidyltransferase family protein [Chlamydiae bacterium]|nr:CDP-alcohol phosphatidyltransferase family protein [Chlamydiota bacterium]
MFTLSNVLSLVRGPLAFLFLINRVDVRAFVILAAILTDCVDGYLARRYKHTTKLGAILDPLMDKFFVFFVVSILFYENRLGGLEIAFMLLRDMVLFGFSLFLLLKKAWKNYNYRSLWWGKATTSLQFIVLLFLALNIRVTSLLFSLFVGFGICVFLELFFTLKTNPEKV